MRLPLGWPALARCYPRELRAQEGLVYTVKVSSVFSTIWETRILAHGPMPLGSSCKLCRG